MTAKEVLITGYPAHNRSMKELVGQKGEVLEVHTTYRIRVPWMEGEEEFWIGEGYVKELSEAVEQKSA